MNHSQQQNLMKIIHHHFHDHDVNYRSYRNYGTSVYLFFGN
jgi:hypothetical protein